MNLLIYGFGGFGRMLASLIKQDCLESIIGVFDYKEPFHLQDNIHYLGRYDATISPELPIIIAIGNNQIREEVSKKISHRYFTYIHPSAYVADVHNVSEGCIILQNVVIQHEARIAKHCIIQPLVLIDHEVQINEYSHIYPNSTIGSNSVLSSKTLIEANTSLPRNSIL